MTNSSGLSESMASISDDNHKWLALAADVCEQAALGNLEPRLVLAPADGDMGRLSRALNHLLDVEDAFVREAGASLDHAAQGKFYRQFVLRGGKLSRRGTTDQ
jgi:hypothetical protein